MALSVGTRLGPYEIVAALGAGGMGEVYRARDLRLGRAVAIKVLPAGFASDPERLARFEREARVLSKLNHPNVLAIYDVGAQGEVHYLVSEFLEGQTLRQQIPSHGLPPRKVIEYALQVAMGLAAAHEKGVVHRDLKPENIFITREQRAKILDFGLAKQRAVPAADDATTLTGASVTTSGAVMGTVGYMAPEQVQGQPSDQRSDIFSFGAIMYEMLSGKSAFRRGSAVESMNAILKEDPPEFASLNLQVDPGLERNIRRCLEKQPNHRFQSASDLAFALESLQPASAASSRAPAAAAPRARLRRRLSVGAAAVGLLLLIYLVAHFAIPRTLQPGFRQITFRRGYVRLARFAADGHTVIFGGFLNGEPIQLYQVRTDTLESQALGIPTADLLAVSRSGEIAIALDRSFDELWVPIGRLARVPIGGGAPREMLDGVSDADWSPNGSGIAVARPVAGRFRIEYPIGTVLYETGGCINDIRFSPKGDQIAFADHPICGDDRGFVSVVDLTGKKRTLTSEWQSVQGLAWSPGGDEILFTAGKTVEPNTLWAVSLSGGLRHLLASPVRLRLEDAAPDGRILLTTEAMHWDAVYGNVASGKERDLSLVDWELIVGFSQDGKTALLNDFSTGNTSNYNLYLRRTDGSPPIHIGEGMGCGISPDGKWVASILPTADDRLSLIPTGTGENNVLTAGRLHYRAAAWFPDGKRLLIDAAETGQAERTYVQDTSGGPLRALTPQGMSAPHPFYAITPGVSPDGKLLLVRDTEGKYWLYPLAGGEARPVSGLLPGDIPVEWYKGGEKLFVRRPRQATNDIYTIDLGDGQRRLWKTIGPTDLTGLPTAPYLLLTQNGSQYVYTSNRIFSSLFVVKGLK
jgi:hypothetical protein